MWNIHYGILLLLFTPFSHSSNVEFSGSERRHILNVNSTAPTTLPTISSNPTVAPTLSPTISIYPTLTPTVSPTMIPTISPTLRPTISSPPSIVPSPIPSISESPTPPPTTPPTQSPTTVHPTPSPTFVPTMNPSISVMPSISLLPTPVPTISLPPSPAPTALPTLPPSPLPTQPPSFTPTVLPTPPPTQAPTSTPTSLPTSSPTPLPTFSPHPSAIPTPPPSLSLIPSPAPSHPTVIPSPSPTSLPSMVPSPNPSQLPTSIPTDDTFVSVLVSIVLYVNLESASLSKPTARQSAEVKTQLANLTDIPEANMYGFSLTKSDGVAPTPAPTSIPTPVPTPVPTGICGCPVSYYIYIGGTTQKTCRASQPETAFPYICCQYCCHRTAGVCNTDFGNTSLYDLDVTRRLSDGLELHTTGSASYELPNFEESEEIEPQDLYTSKDDFKQLLRGPKQQAALPSLSSSESSFVTKQHALTQWEDLELESRQHRELASFYWDVSYRVLGSASQLGYDTVTSSELATSIFDKIYNAGRFTLKITNTTSVYPEKAGSDTLVARGITRNPTPQPSSPAPSRTPTHAPSQTVVPSLVPTSQPVPHPVALPTLSPSHAPTRYFIKIADAIDLDTSLYVKVFPLFVPAVIFFIAFAAICCVTYCRETFWFCFPDEDLGSLTMFSSFAGHELSSAKNDEKYVEQHRSGAVYSWAKQFHSKYLVMGTPTGLKLNETFKEVELQQMEPYSRLLSSRNETKQENGELGDDFLRAIDNGGTVLPKIPQMQKKVDDKGNEVEWKDYEQLDRLESIAVTMAMKQQELVNALNVAEERQSELQHELKSLRNSKGHRAKVASINQDTMNLGSGEHTSFLDSWLAGGAMIDGHIKEAPQYEGGLTKEEKEAMKKLKAMKKAQKKASEAKARRRSQRGSFNGEETATTQRSNSMRSQDSVETGEGSESFGEMARRVAQEEEGGDGSNQNTQSSGWGALDVFGGFSAQ